MRHGKQLNAHNINWKHPSTMEVATISTTVTCTVLKPKEDAKIFLLQTSKNVPNEF